MKRQIPLFEHVFCVIGMRNPLDVLLVNISDLSGNIASLYLNSPNTATTLLCHSSENIQSNFLHSFVMFPVRNGLQKHTTMLMLHSHAPRMSFFQLQCVHVWRVGISGQHLDNSSQMPKSDQRLWENGTIQGARECSIISNFPSCCSDLRARSSELFVG